MRGPVQIVSFSCFLFSVTFVQGQECLGEDITYENTQPVVNVSYADGETVNVNCMTGYIGFYKLKCKNGQWLTVIARRCSKKKCGHPEETPNGYFKLIEGRDYTYGATVEYTCKTGYEMTSRINRRHCRIKGWDNSVPVCEEVRCPVIHTDGEVTASGNTKEGTYGDVIHFECVSSDKKLDGNSVIYCTENSVWSGPVPQCIVTCQLEVTEPEIRTIPWGKTVFKAGETVGMICSGKNRAFNKQETFTCTNNGKWDYKPTCEGKISRCEVPLNQHVYLPKYYFSGDLNLGAKRSYSCESGYRETAAEATCTRDGWTPKPLCTEIMCDPPTIPNAKIVGSQKSNYKIGSRIEYKCRPGFEPEEPVQITCDSQGQWTGTRQCSGMVQLDFRKVQCSQPTKNLQFVTLSDEKTEYSNFEILTYTCNKPYNEIPRGVLMCQNGKWNETFDCKSKICPPPPYLQHGDYSINSTKDEVITAVSYTCQSYYVITKQQDVYKCVDGKWETPPKCLRPCEIDDIVEKYNLQLPTEKVYIRHAEKYTLNCRDGWNTGSELKPYVDVSCSNGNLQIDKSCEYYFVFRT
uniref:Complement factor H like 3 n=1 Tax=Sinocyclocheilus anshuiensis TaxID=1608454 RepID=A0A671R6L4_9TELE